MSIFRLQSQLQKISLLLFIMIFGAGGALLAGLSFAGSQSSPIGFADYCSLESNNTVIYGWAHDEDAPAGSAPSVTIQLSNGKSITVPTDRAGYRDSQINQYVSAKGYATSSVYGFRAQFSDSYKGTAPSISGTILNYGAGGNVELGINDIYGPVDGSSLPYFPERQIPDSCLATAPAAAPSPLKPAPRPATRPASPSSPTTPPAPTIASDADATVSPGTLAANFVVPAGNAALIRINYGTVDGTLTNGSQEVLPEAGNATIKLTGLQPKTQYFYQINRLNADKSVTISSSSSSFTTPRL